MHCAHYRHNGAKNHPVKVLLELGANTRAKNDAGETPIDFFNFLEESAQKEEIRKLLIKGQNDKK
jgi:hypothetical protein